MEQRTTKMEPYRRLLSAVIVRAIDDVVYWEVKGKRFREGQMDYRTALTYLNSDRCTAHLAMLGVDMTGKDILKRIRDGRISEVTSEFE